MHWLLGHCAERPLKVCAIKRSRVEAFSSPKLKKFWLRVFRKLKTKILLAPTISAII